MSAQMNPNTLAAIATEVFRPKKGGQVIGYMINGAFICADTYIAPAPPKAKITHEARVQMVSAIDERAAISTRDSGYDRPGRITCRASRGTCRLVG